MLGVCFVKKQIFGILLVLFLFCHNKRARFNNRFDFSWFDDVIFSLFVCSSGVCYTSAGWRKKKLWKVSFFSQNIVSDFLMKCPCGFRQAVTRVSRPISFLVTRQPSWGEGAVGSNCVHLLSCEWLFLDKRILLSYYQIVVLVSIANWD